MSVFGRHVNVIYHTLWAHERANWTVPFHPSLASYNSLFHYCKLPFVHSIMSTHYSSSAVSKLKDFSILAIRDAEKRPGPGSSNLPSPPTPVLPSFPTIDPGGSRIQLIVFIVAQNACWHLFDYVPRKMLIVFIKNVWFKLPRHVRTNQNWIKFELNSRFADSNQLFPN